LASLVNLVRVLFSDDPRNLHHPEPEHSI
jgi:hypothetical protein